MRTYINKLLLFLIILIPIKVNAIVEPTAQFYINDYADILSQETKDYIYNHSNKLDQLGGVPIAVVTINSLDNVSIDNYAEQLFNNWNISNNGLLILLVANDSKIKVEVGSGIKDILKDIIVENLEESYMLPYIRARSWDYGLANGYKAFYKEIVLDKNINIEYDEPEEISDYNIIYPGIPSYIFDTNNNKEDQEHIEMWFAIILLAAGGILGLVIFFYLTIIVDKIIPMLIGIIALCTTLMNILPLEVRTFNLGLGVSLAFLWKIFFDKGGRAYFSQDD